MAVVAVSKDLHRVARCIAEVEGQAKKRWNYFFGQSVLSEDWPLFVYAPTSTLARLPACLPIYLTYLSFASRMKLATRKEKAGPFFRPRAGRNESRDLDGPRLAATERG